MLEIIHTDQRLIFVQMMSYLLSCWSCFPTWCGNATLQDRHPCRAQLADDRREISIRASLVFDDKEQNNQCIFQRFCWKKTNANLDQSSLFGKLPIDMHRKEAMPNTVPRYYQEIITKSTKIAYRARQQALVWPSTFSMRVIKHLITS